VDDGSGDGGGSLGVDVRADAAKLTNVVIARFGNRGNVVRKRSVLVEDETKVASRVGGVERRVMDFGKLLGESDE